MCINSETGEACLAGFVFGGLDTSMTGFKLWLENQEAEQSIRDQLATAMNMQQQKETLDKLDIETFRPTVLKAMERSKGTFLQRIPAERFMAAMEWVRTAKGQNISDLIAILVGRQSVDASMPVKKKAPPMKPLEPQQPVQPQPPAPQPMAPQPQMPPAPPMQ